MPDDSLSVSTIHARVGEPVVIEVVGVPTAGYRWSLQGMPHGIKLLDEQRGPGGPGIGAARTHRFTLEPTEAGEQTFELQYKRPWEQRPQETKRYVLHVSER